MGSWLPNIHVHRDTCLSVLRDAEQRAVAHVLTHIYLYAFCLLLVAVNNDDGSN